MIDAILLIQDVQLLCFTVIFGFVALQYRGDATRRWIFYSFLANAVGAVLDLSSAHVPAWLGREGLSLAMIPLSYALMNVAIVNFLRRFSFTYWLSAAIVLGTLPFLLLWSGHPSSEAWRSYSFQDFAIALQSVITGTILLGSSERSTRAPRLLLSGFYWLFALVEFARFYAAFLLKRDPDSYGGLELTSSVAYVVATSVLPLAFIWMINSRLESDLLAQNMLDPLTQLQNRRGLRHALDREVGRHLRTDSPLTVTILDLDRFKKLNDTYGHAIGDAVLVSIAALLRRTLRETDTVARLGGEEFVVLLPHTAVLEAIPLLERLRIEIENHEVPTDSGIVRVTASFGVTGTRIEELTSASELLREADLALYRAKEDGRNRVNFYLHADDHGEQLPERQRPRNG